MPFFRMHHCTHLYACAVDTLHGSGLVQICQRQDVVLTRTTLLSTLLWWLDGRPPGGGTGLEAQGEEWRGPQGMGQVSGCMFRLAVAGPAGMSGQWDWAGGVVAWSICHPALMGS